MADSNITKRALAEALKELMEEKSFSKISVADICGKCNMNRKSFYYHFKDKYDLVNWIFDTEFISVMSRKAPPSFSTMDLIEALCIYFYKNRSFYRKTLSVQEQNSFSDHFHELLSAFFQSRLREQTGADKVTDFQVNLFSDAAVSAFQRWILDKSDMTPEDFMTQLTICIQCIVEYENF